MWLAESRLFGLRTLALDQQRMWPSPEYRVEAVRLIKAGGKSMLQISRDLGVSYESPNSCREEIHAAIVATKTKREIVDASHGKAWYRRAANHRPGK
jgi:transposase-like protein